MAAETSSLLGALRTRRELLAKLFRYAATSAIGVVIGQSLLFTFHSVLDMDATLSNLLAVVISSVPAYLINRYWVWQVRDGNSFKREVVPFFAMALIGLALSSILVQLTSDRTEWAVAIGAANLAGFGIPWVAKFFVLDRLLFNRPEEAGSTSAL